MKVVYKYRIPCEFSAYKEFDLSLPYGATLLKTTVQDEGEYTPLLVPYLYANIETLANEVKRSFFVVWTGNMIETERSIEYIDTFTINNLVYHLYEIIR